MAKIAFFLPYLAGGGAERVCLTLASGFLDRGHSVDVVLAQAGGELLAEVPPGARRLDLGARRTLAAVFPLAAYLRRERPDALIAAPDHANPVAIWAGLLSRRRTRVLVGAHTYVSRAVRESHKLQEKVYPLLLRLFYRSAWAILAVADGVADDLSRTARIPRGRIRTVHNPIPLDRIAALAAQTPAHPWLKAGQPPVVLAAGRLAVEKDYPTLIKAFARLRQRRPARLMILGEGTERKRLLSTAKELGVRADFDLPGFQTNPFAFMSRCGVFALASFREGLPTVLVEALACGAQVVATDCPSGPAEILAGGCYGRLVPVGDDSALAEALQEALDHPLPVSDLKARAADFSVGKAVDEYLALLGLA